MASAAELIARTLGLQQTTPEILTQSHAWSVLEVKRVRRHRCSRIGLIGSVVPCMAAQAAPNR
jgi:hypothetical protein